jgi:hypothetical protein
MSKSPTPESTTNADTESECDGSMQNDTIKKISSGKSIIKNKYLRRLSTGSFFFMRAEQFKESTIKETEGEVCGSPVESSDNLRKIGFFGLSARRNKLTKKSSFDAPIFVNDKQKRPVQRCNSNASCPLGHYEIDIEKLTRELAIPTLNKPLTSFKPIDSQKQSANLQNSNF